MSKFSLRDLHKLAEACDESTVFVDVDRDGNGLFILADSENPVLPESIRKALYKAECLGCEYVHLYTPHHKHYRLTAERKNFLMTAAALGMFLMIGLCPTSEVPFIAG